MHVQLREGREEGLGFVFLALERGNEGRVGDTGGPCRRSHRHQRHRVGCQFYERRMPISDGNVDSLCEPDRVAHALGPVVDAVDRLVAGTVIRFLVHRRVDTRAKHAGFDARQLGR